MKEVIYFNEADRPKQEKPLSFTEFSEKKFGRIARDEDEIQRWVDINIDKTATEYHEYLSNFKTNEKPVEFTHYLGVNGWHCDTNIGDNIIKVVYLGKCQLDGDMFATYIHGAIGIYKGHLNSGKF